jgi:hypothetical protein
LHKKHPEGIKPQTRERTELEKGGGSVSEMIRTKRADTRIKETMSGCRKWQEENLVVRGGGDVGGWK